MKKNVRFIGFYIILIILVVMAGCSEKASNEPEEEKETPVKTASVTYGNLSDSNLFAGTIIPNDEAELKPKTTAEIKDIRVKKGDDVKKGDILAVLDDFEEKNALDQQRVSLKQSQSELKNAQSGRATAKLNYEKAKSSLDQAEASLDEAKKSRDDNLDDMDFQIKSAETALEQSKKSLERVEALYEEGLTSEQNYDEAKDAVNQAEQSLDKAKMGKSQTDSDVGLRSLESSVDQARIGVQIAESSINEAEVGIEQANASVEQSQLAVESAEEGLENKTITAPISGHVTELMAEVGEMASPQEPFANIVAVDQVKASVNVLPSIMESFSKGDAIEVEVVEVDELLEGTISYISPMSSDSGLFTVEADLDTKDKTIRPGMIASFVIDEELATDSILIPTEAIVRKEGLDIVFVIEDGLAVQKEVEIDHYHTETTAVTGELKENDQIIISGQNLLEDGDKVTVMEEE